MNKPTRDEFFATVLAKWPGARSVAADRGLYIIVGSADVAMAIELEAKAAGFKPTRIDRRGPEDFLVAVFGFPRRRR